MVGGDDDTLASSGSTIATLGGAAGPGGPVAELVAKRYQIVRWLGGGGMGRVYEALDTELGERIALKVLRNGLTEEALERFRREVKLTRRIQHANVARMFDIGDHQGDRFLTMELVEGEPLTRELGPPMAWARLQSLALQLCAGLAAAHRAGVIHRDLKPDNVLIERGTDRLVITDFGIARGGDEAQVTQLGSVIGTPRYMAPEQLAGGDIDARVDLFSLGVMLYELASGARPWPGDNAVAVAVAQATQPARPIGRVLVPPAFVALIERCLELERDRRIASADELAAAIAALPGASAATLAAPGEPGRSPRLSTPPHGSPTAHPAGPTSPAEDTTIAVLPFSCAPGDEYIADGVFEDLIDTLSTTRSLRVRPAGIVRQATTPDPRELGRALEVDHVIVGSLRRTPAGVRLSARLIGVADGFQIWAHRVDCDDNEVLAASEQLGAGVARALSARASGVTRPMDPRAVDLYLRARAELRRFWSEHAVNAADLLEQAAAIAPTSGPVLSSLAFARVQVWLRRGDHDDHARARAATEQALATGYGEAYLASAMLGLNEGEVETAAADLGRAMIRVPMSAQAHEVVARMLVEVGDLADARHHFQTAIGLDPGRTQMIATDLARVEALAGDWAASDRWIAPIVGDPDVSIAQAASIVDIRLGLWQGDAQRMNRGVELLSRRLDTKHQPDAGARGGATLVQVYRGWLAGQPFDLAAWRAAMPTERTPGRPIRVQLIALQRMTEVAVAIGQPDAALECLRAAFALGLVDRVWLDHCPLFTTIATDPRWRALRDEVAVRAGRAFAAYRATTG